jgi:hypothetical protein
MTTTTTSTSTSGATSKPASLPLWLSISSLILNLILILIGLALFVLLPSCRSVAPPMLTTTTNETPTHTTTHTPAQAAKQPTVVQPTAPASQPAPASQVAPAGSNETQALQQIPAKPAEPDTPKSTETLTATTTPTFTPTETPTPDAPAGQPTQSMVPQGYAYCLPTAVTSLRDRQDMTINNTRVTLQVRDLNTCPRALWEHETGIATGQVYVVDMPKGWAVVVFPTTVAVHREGGTKQEYLNQEVVIVHGPFRGVIGAYEAGVRVVPEEWIDALIALFEPIQKAQAGHPVQIVHIR